MSYSPCISEILFQEGLTQAHPCTPTPNPVPCTQETLNQYWLKLRVNKISTNLNHFTICYHHHS